MLQEIPKGTGMGSNVQLASLEELVALVQEEITKKLDSIEERLDMVSDAYDVLDEKVEQLSAVLNERAGACTDNSSSDENNGQMLPLEPGVTVITLNTADDYPNGSWLGDETRPELRVRCPMTPTELFHINTTCTSAEKMALTLLDYLFDRETQACSNISGAGKHKKKKLDPLFIYGIQCHLIAHFGITGDDWFRIKQNIDSKCRTAFRRKAKGLPLSPKVCHASQHSNDGMENLISGASASSSSDDFSNLSASVSPDLLSGTLSSPQNSQLDMKVGTPIDESLLAQVFQQTGLVKTGDIHILRSTSEQLTEFQQTHQMEVLSSGHVLTVPVQSEQSETRGNT